jgi:Domain of unknown function (DUF5916)/Carbohydrate family 9 binding domain-like
MRGRTVRLTILACVACAICCRAASAGASPQATQQAATAQPSIDYNTARLDRIVHALRIDEPIVIDGRLSEPAWQRAQPATHFVQWNPSPGKPASYDTDARFLYDSQNLYVGVRCFDPEPDKITVSGLEREFNSGIQDGIGLFFDSMHDGQTGFYFATNPVGAHHDFQSSADDAYRNNDWEGVWDVRVTIDEQGWIAEFIVPFKTLRFSDDPNQEWGLNIMRRIRRYNEDSHWAPLPRRYRVARSSMAGTLTGLENVHQGRNLKIKPFGISKTLDTQLAPGTQHFDGGFDVKYGLTESLTTDFSYRTDFSQVEADQQQVNLTRFNLFFPEKREFFLENSGIFGVASSAGASGSTSDNVIPFFSRRIGLSAAGIPIPIEGGARLSGKTGPYDVGLLAMRTGEFAGWPADTFLVGRLRRNFRGQSSIGAIMTSRSSSASDNQLFGVDAFLRFFEKLEVSSYLMGTNTPAREGQDLSTRLGLAWRDDDLTAVGEYEDVQANFNPEVGFVRRENMKHSAGDLSWRPRPASGGRVRNYLLGGTTDYFEASDTGKLETRQHSASAGVSFQDGSSFTATATNTFDRLEEPFAIQPGIVIPVGDYEYTNGGASYSSDPSRPFSGGAGVTTGGFWDGHNTTVTGNFTLKPNYHLSVGMNYSRNDVNLPYGDFTTTLVGTRVLYGFTSRLLLNSFLQYNASTHQFSSNTRFNFIHHPMSDLYVVYNERRDTNTGALIDRGLIVKLTNLFDF